MADDDDDKSEKSAESPQKVASSKPSPEDNAKALQKKTTIADRLTLQVEAAEMAQKRSPELFSLKADYDTMRARLRTLLSATRKYRDTRQLFERTRAEFSKQITTVVEAKPVTFMSLVYEQAATQGEKDDKKMDDILDYVTEWESIVSTRVDGELKEVKKLADSLRHYEVKVDSLRKKKNDAVAKGKTYDPEKLERNEGKLKIASEAHEGAATRLAYLITEVTRNGYLDLFPMVRMTMTYEAARSSKEATIFSKFQTQEEQFEKQYKKPEGAPKKDIDLVKELGLDENEEVEGGVEVEKLEESVKKVEL